MRLKPQYVKAWKDLGTVLKEQGKKEEGIDAYQTVVQYEKDSPGVWLTLGLLLEEQGEIEKAKQALSNTVKYQPDNAEEHDIGIVWAKWGALLEQDGKIEDAITKYRRAVSHMEDEQVYHKLALLLAEAEKPKEAEEMFRNAIKTDPAYPNAWCDLGIHLKNQGRYDEAKEKLRTALNKTAKESKTYLEAHYHLARLFALQQEIQAVVSHLDRVFTKDPSYVQRIEKDPYFDTIRSKEEFQGFLNNYRK